MLPWLIGQAIIGFCLLETVNYLDTMGFGGSSFPTALRTGTRRTQLEQQHVVANVFLFHLHATPTITRIRCGATSHCATPTRRRNCRRLRHDDAPRDGPALWRRVMDHRVIDITAATSGWPR